MRDEKNKSTSWGHVAFWYESLLEKEGTYQKELILPNLLRLMDISPKDKILDVACGPGFFSFQFAQKGAKVLGIDISPELIAIAREKSGQDPAGKRTMFAVASANSQSDLSFISDGSINKIAIILALENIKDVPGVFSQCRRVLSAKGSMHLVLTHPAFRIPGGSSWEWDEEERALYRRVDTYLSESATKIKIHPGSDPKSFTVSFHRPLQWYFKHMSKKGFCVTRMEEWISHRKSQEGPRKAQEDRVRKEIPLFLYLEARPTPCQNAP